MTVMGVGMLANGGVDKNSSLIKETVSANQIINEDIMAYVFLALSALFFWIGWMVFCITRGAASLSLEQKRSRFKYTALELYEIGNPFSSYAGRGNW